jgi:hypothetical protein
LARNRLVLLLLLVLLMMVGLLLLLVRLLVLLRCVVPVRLLLLLVNVRLGRRDGCKVGSVRSMYNLLRVGDNMLLLVRDLRLVKHSDSCTVVINMMGVVILSGSLALGIGGMIYKDVARSTCSLCRVLVFPRSVHLRSCPKAAWTMVKVGPFAMLEVHKIQHYHGWTHVVDCSFGAEVGGCCYHVSTCQ